MRRVILLFLLSGLLHGFSPAPVQADDISLSDMVHSVQVALRNAQSQIAKDKLPSLDTVTLSLKTTLKKEVTGGFTLFIVSFGGAETTVTTSSVTIKLVPPKADAAAHVTPIAEISNTLKESILAAAKSIRAARAGKPRLEARSIEVTLAFALLKEDAGGLHISFLPFEGGVTGGISNSHIQTIKVVFQ